MTPGAFSLLRELADGRSLSGAGYAERRGLSRAAVWKQVQQLREAGLPVQARPGAGYRLAWPIEPLQIDRIAAAAPADCSVAVHDQVDSTNRWLTDRFAHRAAVLAEFQYAGRGRRGRAWISPPACGIWLSFGYRFDCGLQRLSALSLAVGIAVAETLPVAVRLKWPNDLTVADAKLGGVLIELRGAADGPCEAVIGVGINARLPDLPAAGNVDSPWTDLHRAGYPGLDRSRLAGTLVAALDSACAEFASVGFDAFEPRWRALDGLSGREVVVLRSTGSTLRGTADGVNRRGELRLRTGDGCVELDSGEVSVRVA